MLDRAVQAEVLDWALRVFGPVALNKQERAIRFLEEALEVAHVCEVPQDVVKALSARVWSRDTGNVRQEIAQAFLTLESLAEVCEVSLSLAAEDEWNICRAKAPEFYRDKYEKKIAAGLTVHALGWKDTNNGG